MGPRTPKLSCRPVVIVLGVLLSIAVTARAGGGDGDAIAAWTAASPDLRTLGSGQVQWPEKDEIESFFPLGFSEDGWLAHANRLEGLLLERPVGSCRGETPCFDVSLFNVHCDDPCAGDVDPSAGANCRCVQGVLARHLEEFGIRPPEGLRLGELPARFGGVEYDVELTFREKAIYSEVWQEPQKPEFPETRVFLVAEGRERKLVAAIDHNHSGLMAGVRVAGWLEHPESGRLVVFLLVQRTWAGARGAAPYALYPIAAELHRRTEERRPLR